MTTYKLNIHSSVDLITNSSTTIFTYSSGSLGKLRELVNEMLKVFNRTDTFDDIFYAKVFLDDDYRYLERDKDEYEKDENPCPRISHKDLDLLIDDILSERIEKPRWMLDIEECDKVLQPRCKALHPGIPVPRLYGQQPLPTSSRGHGHPLSGYGRRRLPPSQLRDDHRTVPPRGPKDHARRLRLSRAALQLSGVLPRDAHYS